jgi:hypothetical protein
VKDLTDEVITATTARAEELFFELVDTLAKEDDPIGVACSLLVQLTRFVAEADQTPKEFCDAEMQPTSQTAEDRA